VANHLGVFLDGKANHVDQQLSAAQPSGQPGKMVAADSVDPGIGQPYRVEHSPGELGYTGRRIPLSRLEGDRLGYQTAQAIEIQHSIQLASKAGGARGQK
jgi:hypothetical protein